MTGVRHSRLLGKIMYKMTYMTNMTLPCIKAEENLKKASRRIGLTMVSLLTTPVQKMAGISLRVSPWVTVFSATTAPSAIKVTV